MRGIRVELEISSPSSCPVAEATSEAATSARGITWSRGDRGYVEQFALEGSGLDEPYRSVFEYGGESVYEFTRETTDCPCERIEAAGQPVADVRAEDGSLFVTLHLSERSDLSELIADLSDEWGNVSIRTISRPDANDNADDVVPVDRSVLTDRQREVLETAYEMGYFERPRKANATEVSEALGISVSTLSEHMAAAHSKILSDLIGFRQSVQQ